MTHDLKLVQPHFNDVKSRTKTFEVRKDDRDYNVGDTLILRLFDSETQMYDGEFLMRKITYLLRDKQYVKEGFVILGID